MCTFDDIQTKIQVMIDDLKGLCSQCSLSNSASEEVIVTTVFLYKFLNDKYMYNLQKWAKKVKKSVDELLKDDSLMEAFKAKYGYDVVFDYKDTIQYLISDVSKENFYKTFDKALEDLSDRNKHLSIKTSDGTYQPLFEKICELVPSNKRILFARTVFSIIATDKIDFSSAFSSSFDFYSSIFEYLIKDYNVASGTYAEYFTPQSVSNIIAKCLVGMSDVIKASEIYDPSAGSGSLVLHLGNELRQEDGTARAIVYTQDISQKSSRFLRLNLILNGMTESLDNVVCGDTLVDPSHFETPNQESSGLKHFDYIVANPPFKLDFSSTRNLIESKWTDTDRFFAGVPNIPPKDKDSMAIYLPFIQHALYSLKDEGKMAIVVPTGFLTAKGSIEKTIRQTLVDNNWIKGVISMPPNIFANTSTNVSVLFIDKANKSDTAIFVDASQLGTKVKVGKNQKTVLSNDEIKRIINTFTKHKPVKDFASEVSFDEIAKKNYSFSAGQYFEVVIEYCDISQDDFKKRMMSYKKGLKTKFSESHKLEKEIMKQIEGLQL